MPKVRALLVQLALVLLGAIALPCVAQPTAPEAGLPFVQTFAPRTYQAETQNWVAVQDARGLVYIGNNDGVLEYDGVTWRLIPVSNHSTVRALAIVPSGGDSGRIYVGAKGELGYLAADAQGRLRYNSLLPHLPRGDNLRRVDQILIQSNGNVLFVLRDMLVHWDGRRASITNGAFGMGFTHAGNTYIVQQGEGLAELTAGKLVSVAGTGLLADAQLQAYIPLPDGTTILATRNQGLLRFDGRTLTPIAQHLNPFLKANRLFSAVGLPNGLLALGTLGAGVWIVDQQGRPQQVLDRSTGLPDANILCLFVDQEQALWVGTNNGISRLFPGASLTYFNQAQGLFGGVTAAARFRGDVYAGTAQGLFRLRTQASAASLLNLTGAHIGRFDRLTGFQQDVWSLLATPDGLIVGAGSGTYVLDQPNAAPRKLFGAITYNLLLSRHSPGTVYCATTEGLDVLQLQNGRYQYLGRVQGYQAELRSLYEDNMGVLWIGTSFDGIAYRPAAAPSLDPILQRLSRSHGLPNESNCNVFGIRGQVVVATRAGVWVPQRIGDTLRLVPDPRFANVLGPRPPYVLNLRELPDNSLLVNLYPSRRTLTLQPAADGKYQPGLRQIAPLQQLDLTSFQPDGDSLLWIAASEALVRLELDSSPRDTSAFRAIVRQVVRGDSIIFGGAIPAGGLNQTPVLAYNGPALRFELGHSGFDPSGSVQYQYRLEGYDDTWSDWKPEPVATYTTLPAGTYQLWVRVRDGSGNVSAPDVYRFQMDQAWYLRWWMLALYGLLLLGLMAIIIWWRNRRLETEKHRLEQLVSERTRELAQQKQAVEQANLELNQKHDALAQAMDDLKRMQRQLIVSEKLAALGHLVQGMAHHLNTPVGAAKAALGNLDQLLPGLLADLPDWLVQQPQHIRASFVQASQLVLSKSDELSTREERNQRRLLEQQLVASGHPNATELARPLVEIQLADHLDELQPILNSPQALQAVEHLHRLGRIRLMMHTLRDTWLMTERIVVALKQYSKAEEPAAPEPVHLQATLDTAMAQLVAKLRQEITVIRGYQGTQPLHVLAQHDDLVLVWTQLLQNACQAMPNGGMVSVNIQLLPEAATVQVKDVGHGVPTALADRIFEPFFTTRTDGQGTGLGLDLARRLVQKYGGTIAYTSQPGETTFTVRLQLANRPA